MARPAQKTLRVVKQNAELAARISATRASYSKYSTLAEMVNEYEIAVNKGFSTDKAAAFNAREAFLNDALTLQTQHRGIATLMADTPLEPGSTLAQDLSVHAARIRAAEQQPNAREALADLKAEGDKLYERLSQYHAQQQKNRVIEKDHTIDAGHTVHIAERVDLPVAHQVGGFRAQPKDLAATVKPEPTMDPAALKARKEELNSTIPTVGYDRTPAQARGDHLRERAAASAIPDAVCVNPAPGGSRSG